MPIPQKRNGELQAGRSEGRRSRSSRSIWATGDLASKTTKDTISQRRHCPWTRTAEGLHLHTSVTASCPQVATAKIHTTATLSATQRTPGGSYNPRSASLLSPGSAHGMFLQLLRKLTWELAHCRLTWACIILGHSRNSELEDMAERKLGCLWRLMARGSSYGQAEQKEAVGHQLGIGQQTGKTRPCHHC